MISDLAARNTALDPQRSFIVQAPAGSGKTGLLVYRLLTLLATVDQPQQVLAITFTRKATAEMRERLLHLMHAAEAGESSDDAFEQQGIDLAKKVLARDLEKNWNLLNTPHQLQLLTIDAFCAKLTASMPWLSRLGDRPRTTDQADTHYAAAVESLLSELLNEDSAIAAPLKTVLLELDYNYNKARALFGSMLAKRDQWLRHLLQHDLSSLRETLEQSWRDVVDAQLEELQTVLPEGTVAQMVKLAIYAAPNIKPKEGKTSILEPFNKLASDVDAYANSSDGDEFSASVNQLPVSRLSVAQWQALCSLALLADGKGFRKTVTIGQGFVAKSAEKEAFVALLGEFADDESLREVMAETLLLPEPEFSDQDWQQLISLEVVLKSLAAFLQLRFRAVGECDHSEVTQRANLALQELDNPTDLGLRMDYHLQHILVDEFQDTSNGQIELLKKLTSGWTELDSGLPKTLFLVGDPMQSIYRFREADVSLFLQVANNQQTQVFDNLKIDPLSLTENFRSSSELVDWFNTTFEQSFPCKNNVLTGAINYAPASSQKTQQKGDVVYQLAHSKQQQAQLLVSQIEQTIAEQTSDDDKIAILVRSRGQLNVLLPALQEAGIQYTGVDIQPLKELQAVIDVLALCKAICREDDRVAWLALLRGPWCGLTLTEIKHVSMRNDFTIWQQINNAKITSKLDVNSIARLNRFNSIMEQAIDQRQQVELGSLTRWTWRTLGGEQTLLGASLSDIDTVFNLIDGLQRGGDLPSMNDLDKALSGLYSMPSNANDCASKVVVSTMHKSKGLQYDTVILPGLSSRPRVDDREIMMWAEQQNKHGQSNLLLAPLRVNVKKGGAHSSHFEYLRKLESKRAGNESIRLMYVAATRAERKLVLLANAELDDKTGEVKAPASTSLLATLWDALERKFSFPLEPQDDDEEQALSQQLYRLRGDYQTQYPEPVEWQVTQQLNAQQSDTNDDSEEATGEDDQQQFEWATNAASAVGTILHAWLQYNSADVLSATISPELIASWRTELVALRVPDTQIQYALRNLQTAIENIKTDTQAHFIFKRYDVEQNEYALSAFEGGMVKKSIIDRTFVDENNTRWIVDYKSTPTQKSDLRAFAEEQVEERHKGQLERYGALMSRLDTRPIQLAVYFPLIKQLVCWAYTPKP